MKLQNVEKLLNMMVVYEGEPDMSVADVLEAYQILKKVKAELCNYIESLMDKSEDYFFHMEMPQGSLLIFKSEHDGYAENMIYTPYITTNKKVLDKLKENPSNPVFQVLKFFSDNVRHIRNLVCMYDISEEECLSKELLEELHIYRFAGFFHRKQDFFRRLLYTDKKSTELTKCNYKCTLPALFFSISYKSNKKKGDGPSRKASIPFSTPAG